MSQRTIECYILRALTQMHAGSGDSTYGVIDNLVQRDATTKLPTVNASSLKGALKEHFKDHHWEGKSLLIEQIFGYGSQEEARDEKKFGKRKTPIASMSGTFDFHQASLLSIPVRSDKAPYLSATTPTVLRAFVGFLEQMDAPGVGDIRRLLQDWMTVPEANLSKPLVVDSNLVGAILEEFDIVTASSPGTPASIAQLERLLGSRPVLVSWEHFLHFSENLPTVARNFLDNGESKNLWYEEIVPSESRFYTVVIQHPDNAGFFESVVSAKPIQIGGNATVGYGKTRFLPLANLLKP